MSLQNTGDDEQRRKIAAASGRMVAAILNAVSSFFEALGSLFDVIRGLLEAAALGIRKSAREIGSVFAALLREKLTSWLIGMRRARAVATKTSDGEAPDLTALDPEGIATSSTAIEVAMRQADLARVTAERFQSDAAEKMKDAVRMAERADEAARRHRAMRWEHPPVGPLVFKDSGIIYYGEMSHGDADGYGVFEEGASTVYRGQVRGNRKHGVGVCSQGGKAIYQGQFESHRRHGLGKLQTNTYDYIGQFVADEIREYGVLTRTEPGADWEKHLGFFERAEANGYGVRHFVDGQIHSGEFKNDIPWGFGIRTVGGTITQAGRWEGEECYKL